MKYARCCSITTFGTPLAKGAGRPECNHIARQRFVLVLTSLAGHNDAQTVFNLLTSTQLEVKIRNPGIAALRRLQAKPGFLPDAFLETRNER